MSWVLVKMPVAPHRQRVLVGDDEMRLQQWANKQAAAALREEGKPAGGPEFEAMRDALMREAVSDPDSHEMKFMGGPAIPFDDEGGEEETHTMPDGTEMEGATHEEEPDVRGEEFDAMTSGGVPERELPLGEEEEEPEPAAAEEDAEASVPKVPVGEKPKPSAQKTLDDYMSEEKSFDQSTGIAMLKAIHARMGR